MGKSVEELITQFKIEIKELTGHDIEVFFNVLEQNVNEDLFEILSRVSTMTMVSIEKMRSKRRNRPIVEARQIFCKIAKEETYYTLEEIGAIINKDHATVIHSCRTAKNLIKTNKEYKRKYDDCKNFQQ